ncbi:MAG: NAD-dependent epimerase/dehydratase family protein [Deltaproteobacteria bacterium]|nr:NAD-dependent epimerase/dehydratase family protein [Deltaproteobacteria bacterium]
MKKNKLSNPLELDLDHILHHTKELWEELRGKQIFITGGTGFIGCWLLESFAWANAHLDLNASALVLTRDFNAFQKKAPHLATNQAITFRIGNVRNFTFPEGEFSHVIHAATSASAQLSNEDPLLMFDTIIEGTRRTLDFAVHCNAQKLLLTSSGAVYGKQPSDMTHVSEDYCGAPDPTNPNSAYGEGKRAAELLCSLYSKKYGIETKIARCFAFVGAYLPLDIHYAIGNFIRDGLNGGPIQVNGDGTPYRSYLYAADLAIWLWTILFTGKTCRAYNVGSEEDMTIAEVANTVAQCFEKPVAVKIDKIPDSHKPAERYVPLTKRVQDECGIHLVTDIREGIRRTLINPMDLKRGSTLMNRNILKAMPEETLRCFFNNRSVLITGSNGFVASYLVPRLMKFGAFVHGIDVKESQKLTDCDYRCANLMNFDSIASYINECRPSIVFHLASQSSVGLSWKEEYETIDTNVKSTYNLFKVLELLSTPIRLLLISSGEVYGDIGGRKAVESDKLSPMNPYAVSKAMMEMVAHRFRTTNIQYVIARPFNHTGPGRPATFFDADMAKQFAVARNERRNVVDLKVGNIENIRDFSDVRDIVEEYILLACQGESGEVYNVCSGIETRLKDIILILEKISGIKACITIDENRFRKNDLAYLVGSTNLEFEGRPLEQTMRDLFMSFLT